MTAVLEITGASKTFGATRALCDVTLDVRAGEVHAVMGQNGSGKSTLVKVLAGFHTVDDPATTTVRIDGREIALHDADAAREAGLRFVHQDLALVGDLSTVENLALGVGFDTGVGGHIRWRASRRRARAALEALGYTFDIDAPVDTLRAAERTGIAVVRALADIQHARVLVVDEPTATLPGTEVGMLFEALRRVAAQGVGIIYISHRLNEVFALAQRVTVLRDGSRVGTYDIGEVDHERLVSLMVGDRRLDAHRAERAAPVGPVALSARGLTGVTVLGVDFDVRHGEVLGIAGLTGSGRDELSSLLFGVEQRGGTVIVDGKMVRGGDVRSAIAAGIAFVPPDRLREGQFAEMTVRENCTMTGLRQHAGLFGRIRRRSERDEVEGWITALDIRPPRPDAMVAALSGGNQQKVVLAKWLRRAPAVLLLDEPTQGVDVAAKGTIHQLARRAATDGAAVLIASSDEEELCDVCDRVLVLVDGEIRAELEHVQLSPPALITAQQHEPAVVA